MSEEEPSLFEEMFENEYYLKECFNCSHRWIGDPLKTCPKCNSNNVGVTNHPVEGRLSVSDMEEI